MKKLFLIYLTFFTIVLFGQGKSGSYNAMILNYPTVEGEVLDIKVKLQDVTIKVFNGLKHISTTKTDSLGNYTVRFNLDSVYFVELSKEGYITKKYELSTKDITKERVKDPVNKIIAQTEMHKVIDGVDYSHYKKPMVKFFFNKKTDMFEYDTKHFAKAVEAQKTITEKEKKAIFKEKLKKKK